MAVKPCKRLAVGEVPMKCIRTPNVKPPSVTWAADLAAVSGTSGRRALPDSQ